RLDIVLATGPGQQEAVAVHREPGVRAYRATTAQLLVGHVEELVGPGRDLAHVGDAGGPHLSAEVARLVQRQASSTQQGSYFGSFECFESCIAASLDSRSRAEVAGLTRNVATRKRAPRPIHPAVPALMIVVFTDRSVRIS